LNVTDSFEFINLDKSVPWTTVPTEALVVNGDDDYHTLTTDDDDQEEVESLEIRKPLSLLKDDLQIIITPTNQKINIKQITENIIPIFIYIIDQDILSDNDIDELRYFRSIVPNEPILFIRIDQSDM